MFRRFTEFILLFKWPMALGLILITLLMGYVIRRLQIDPTVELLFNKKSAEYQYYREFQDRYGSDAMIVVAMETDDLFTRQALFTLRKLTRKISAFDQVERVISLANAMDIKPKFIGVRVVPALKKFFEGDEPVEELRRDILSNELFLNNLVSPDGKIANFIIYLKVTGKDRGVHGWFIKALRKILRREELRGYRFYMAGSPVEQYDFIRLLRRDQLVFLPLITVLLMAATWIIYRSFSCMMLAMAIVFVTLLWSFGTIVLLGAELNLVTSLLAPVIMIVAVVNTVHLINLFLEIRLRHPVSEEAVLTTMQQIGIPCFLAHFTTLLGFLSLAISGVPAIQSFGIFAALGTFYSYLAEVLLTPLLLPLLPLRVRTAHPEQDKITHFFNQFLVGYLEKLEFRWKWWILAGTFVVFVLSLAGISKLEVDTSLIKQMKPDHPLIVASRFIDQNVTGIYSLGFVLKRKDGLPVSDYKTLRLVDRFKDYLEAKSEIAKVNSITTLIKTIHQADENDPEAYKIPDEPRKLRAYFKGMAESKNPELDKLVSSDFREIRLEARMRAVGTREGAQLEATTVRYMEKELSPYFDYHLTGNVVLLGKMSKDLVGSQIRGFAIAFGSILLVIAIIFRSVWIGLLAAIPNLLPILTVYGVMGFLHIELSSPTAMISSIVLGLVVDGTIYFLHAFRREFSHRHHYIQSLHHTYRDVGQSLVVAALILMTGFASSIFASFRPTIYFGLLTSLAIFFALICTLVIVPVCLVMLKPFGRERLFSRHAEASQPAS